MRKVFRRPMACAAIVVAEAAANVGCQRANNDI
jgi:hypothetical protein